MVLQVTTNKNGKKADFWLHSLNFEFSSATSFSLYLISWDNLLKSLSTLTIFSWISLLSIASIFGNHLNWDALDFNHGIRIRILLKVYYYQTSENMGTCICMTTTTTSKRVSISKPFLNLNSSFLFEEITK